MRFGDAIFAIVVAICVAVFAPPTQASGFVQGSARLQTIYLETVVPGLKDSGCIEVGTHSGHHGGSQHNHDGGTDGAVCCGVACHASDVSNGPLLARPDRMAEPLRVARSEQIVSQTSGPLDRPPKSA